MHDTQRPTAYLTRAQNADYKAIFNRRGNAYHQAMVEFPDARIQEFHEIIRLANPQQGQTLCDAPSGGGYLQHYLSCSDCEVIALETSEVFYQLCKTNCKHRAILSQLDNIDLPDDSIDCFISLAGLHHLLDRLAFFREAHRILKAGGSCCVADVKTDTKIAEFLNVFVDRWSSMGHKGDFFDSDAPKELELAGFTVIDHYFSNYHWNFQTIDDMCRYITLLFGLDLAQPEDVLQGIEEYLGYQAGDGVYQMNWGLSFMKGVK